MQQKKILYRKQWNKSMYDNCRVKYKINNKWEKTEIHCEMTSKTTFITLTMITIYLVLPTFLTHTLTLSHSLTHSLTN
jgi:hypothetical protein